MSTATKALLLVLLLPVWAWGAMPVVQSYQWNGTGVAADDTARVAKPTSLAEGELVVLLAISANDQNDGHTFTWPSGFTEIADTGNSSYDTYLGAAYKVAGASEPDSYLVAMTQTVEFGLWALRITGQHASTITSGTPNPAIGNGNSIVCQQITTTVDSCLAFYLVSFDGGDGDPFAITAGTGWTETTENASGINISTSVSGAWGTKEMPADGLTGTVSIGADAADGFGGVIFAIAGTVTAPTSKSQIMRTVIIGD